MNRFIKVILLTFIYVFVFSATCFASFSDVENHWASKEIKDFDTLEKTSFSALQTNDIFEYLKNAKKDNVIIFGIEAHICLYQTVLDLLKEKYNVYVIKDCSASRSELNFNASMDLMRQEGAKIATLEIVLFELLKSSKHDKYKECQSLIK